MPEFDFANTEIQNGWDPLLRDDDDVDVPPLLECGIDPVPECLDEFVFVNNIIRCLARPIESPSKRMSRIGFIPLLL